MFKTILKYFVTFGAGSIVGYLVTKKLLEDKYAQLAQEEINSVKEVLGRTTAERFAKQVENAEAKGKKASGVETGKREVNPNGAYASSRIAYNEMAKDDIRKRWDSEAGCALPMDDEDEEEVEEEVDAAGYSESDHTDDSGERDLTGIDRTNPYLITDIEYNEEFDHHDKLSIYYYSYDNTLCDENEKIISDVEGTVGGDVLDILRVQNVAWVRNEPLCTDYEICAVRGSYAELVSGIIPTVVRQKASSPREDYNRKNKNRMDHDDEEE